MKKDDPYHDNKVIHLAAKIAADGSVSAICFDPPRRINLKVATWTLEKEAVTCQKCLAVLREANS